MKGIKKLRPTPALIVAFIALFVAMGGVGYTAVKLKKNAVKTKNIKNGAVTTSKLAKTVKSPDADKLGGKAASAYQGFCEPGAIKGSFVGQPGAPAFVNVVGFNCGQPGNTTTSVQAIRSVQGVYQVKFIGGAGGTGSAVVSANSDDRVASAVSVGNGVFDVKVRDDAGTLIDGDFTLLAF
jgi:hypothetical protein